MPNQVNPSHDQICKSSKSIRQPQHLKWCHYYSIYTLHLKWWSQPVTTTVSHTCSYSNGPVVAQAYVAHCWFSKCLQYSGQQVLHGSTSHYIILNTKGGGGWVDYITVVVAIRYVVHTRFMIMNQLLIPRELKLGATTIKTGSYYNMGMWKRRVK